MVMIKIIGYHITEYKNAFDIIQNKFINKFSKKHYLGQGTYFYTDINVAQKNLNTNILNLGNDKKCIIKAEMNVSQNEFLDLDKSEELTKYRNYLNIILSEIEIKKINLGFNVHDKNAHIKIRCIVLDLYKSEYGYKIIRRTFSNDTPSYGVKNHFDTFSGMPYYETYLCVSDQDCIINKSIINSEDKVII